MPPPSQVSTVFATDESIAVYAGGDYQTLCPDYQTLASGTDGVFDAGDPWTLASAAVDFEAQGVAANHVIALSGPKAAFRGSGALLAVESVSGHSVTLRRLAQASGVGQPPGSGGLSGVSFAVATLYPQVEEASFRLSRRFRIDPNIAGRTPADVYDLRDLRLATVLTVLLMRYAEASRGKGDFAAKVATTRAALDEVLSQLTVRWDPAGGDDQSTTIASMRVSR